MRNKKFWIVDIETIVNCFIVCFEDYKTKEKHSFIINRHHNDLPKLIAFLNDNIKHDDWHFGYNIQGFDSQITEFIIQNQKLLLDITDSNTLSGIFAKYAQEIIEKAARGEWLDYPEFKLSIKTVDIFKLNHWDSPAKRSSLKWIQYSMDWMNVEEMPHHHNTPVLTDEELQAVLEYCENDVASTKAIYLHRNSYGEQVMASQINLRATLSKKYGVNLYSASEPRISKEIFLYFLSNKLGIDKRDIKKMRTYRDKVVLRDIILPSITFTTPEFEAVHNWFKNLVVDTKIYAGRDDVEKGPKHTMMYKGVKTDYGLGGLHGCIKPGIYKAEGTRIILSADVKSFYPNLAIKNKWGPAQFPIEDFCELYEWFYNERTKYGKKDPLNYLFKIILNSTYGLSKEKNSFLYDPELTFRITVNGQLQLSMLYEMLATRIPGAEPLMQNTDGLEFIIEEKYKDLFYDICKEWEVITNLELETVQYDKMIIGDVNNYIAVQDTGEVKCKGRFEFKELPFHKNKSFLIIPMALYAYFMDGKDPVEFLKENRNIFDYCAGVKLKGDWFFVERKIEGGTFVEKKLQKLIRYYISGKDKGVKLIKCNPDGREIQLESSNRYQQIVFNKAEIKPWEEYGVDDSYYLDKIYDEIKNIEKASEMLPYELKDNQLKLF